jgi:hypothetical protein
MVSVLAAGAPDAGKDTHRHAVCVLLLLAHRVVAARAGAAAQLENRIPPGPARQEETVHRTLFHAAGYLFKRSAGACQDVVTAPTIIHSPLPGHGGGLFDSMSAHCQTPALRAPVPCTRIGPRENSDPLIGRTVVLKKFPEFGELFCSGRRPGLIGHFPQGVGLRVTYTEIQGGNQTTPPPP